MVRKTILLVEDDFLNRRLSKKVLESNDYHVLEAKNTKEVKEILKREIIDLAILDINLGTDEQDGISLGQYLQEHYDLPFIYLTAYESADIINKAISTLPRSYLTKPFKNSDLIASVEIALRQTAGKHIPKITVKDGDYHVALPISEIDYIESEGNYLLLHANKKTYKVRSTIKQILEILPANLFAQLHRAYIVNKTKIVRYKTNSVIVGEAEIPVSKNYTDLLTNQGV